jgi:hypothetical protein
MTQKGYGRKQSQPNLWYYCAICWQRLSKLMKNHTRHSLCPGWDTDQACSKYKWEALPLTSPCHCNIWTPVFECQRWFNQILEYIKKGSSWWEIQKERLGGLKRLNTLCPLTHTKGKRCYENKAYMNTNIQRGDRKLVTPQNVSV